MAGTLSGTGRRKIAAALAVLFILPGIGPVWADQGSARVDGAGSGQSVLEVQCAMSFSEEALRFGQLLGYDTVRLEDGDSLNELGEPMLPYQEVRIALPAGMVATSVRVVEARSRTLAGEYVLFPGQLPLRTSEDEPTELGMPPDPGVYSSADAYPGELVELGGQTDLAGQGMAVVRLYPLQYVPAERRLVLHTLITFVVEGVEGYRCGDYLPARLSQRSAVTYRQMAGELVINPEAVELMGEVNPPRGERGVAAGDYDYVIITATGWVDFLQPLADWRTKTGLRATVVGINWILGEYSGADDAEKVRNFVIDAHGVWGAMYFLIACEGDTVPFKYHNYYGENTPSDEYYADFDDDWTNEVFVGRLSVGNTTQINRVIDKIFTYEQSAPSSNYAREALLIGMDLDDQTEAEDMKEDVAAYITAYDPGFGITKVYDSDATNHKDAAVNALNAGKNLVNHSDHCNTLVMGVGVHNHGWDLYTADINDLTNDGEMSVVVSTGCHPNEMDHDDCIAEYWVIRNSNQAGVAFTGNTRDGFYLQGNPGAMSGALDKKWWKGLFEQGKYILGETVVYAKHDFSQSTNQKKHCEWTFNLLGDPAMPLWTDDPTDLIVTYDDPIGGGEQIYIVHVGDASGDVEDATVCLWKGDEVYGVNQTNSIGNASFVIEPVTEGTIYVTATKRNCRPYAGSAEVVLAHYTLTVYTEGSGIVLVDPDQPDYVAGEIVELTPYGYPDWRFDHWSGDLEGDDNPGYVYMDSDKVITAHFVEEGDDCPEDLNGDEHVGLQDLAALLGNYGETGMGPEDGDFDGDGDVDLQDLAQLLSVYNQDCPTR